MTVEFYSVVSPDKLLGAADVPWKTMDSAVGTIGRAFCRALALDAVNAIVIGADGEAIERMMVARK